MTKHLLIACIATITVSLPAAAQKITWKSVLTPGLVEVTDATFGMGTFVAVGKDGTVLHSKNGENWSKGKLDGISCDLNTVEFAFGQFWAGGKNLDTNKAVILLSLDGKQWDDVTDDFDLKENYWSSDSHPESINQFFNHKNAGKETLFISMLNSSGENEIRYSREGSKFISGYLYGLNIFQAAAGLGWIAERFGDETWYFAKNLSGSISSSQDSSFPADLKKLAYGNSFYVGVGPKRTLGFWNGNKAANSWENQFKYATSPAISDYSGVAFGAGCFVAVGTNGAIVESFDSGKSWTAVKLSGLKLNYNGVKFIGNKFVVFGGDRIVTGTLAKQRSWSAATLPSRPSEIYSIATNGKIAVTVGKKGQILYSSNGRSWTKSSLATSNDLYVVDYDATTKNFYATGSNGSLVRSSNGINWFVVNTKTENFLYGVSRAGGRLVAAGAAGSFLTSKDGKVWPSTPSSSLNADVRTVSFGGSTGFIQIYSEEDQQNGQVWINKDGGTKLTKLKKPDSTNFGDAHVFNGQVYLAGYNGNLYHSPQKTVGGSWKKISTRTLNSIEGLASNSNMLTAVGSEGLVFTLQKNNKWHSETIFEGTPYLMDAIYFNKLWIVAGSRGGAGFIATTNQD